jgi:ABC-2 type transport system ATP-binding protein
MITLDHIDFSYGKKSLFKDLDLTIPSGSIYGLLGMNGAGKTSLLKLISGQLFRSSGSAEILGCDPQKRSPAMLEDIFYLPEEFYLPQMTIDTYLRLNVPFYPKFDEAAFSRYIETFKLDLDQKIGDYSYGQKKKFLLSFGLASNTSLLILDEPTNGLDIPSKTQFRRTVASALTGSRTFIISTHQVRDMENLIDPIIILHDGRIIFNDSLESVSDTICMQVEDTEPMDDQVIYSEHIPGGYSVVRRRSAAQAASHINLETLFNAVVTAPEAFEGVQS